MVFALLLAACMTACSIPNLETSDCVQARDTVREFYSFHFGNDMTFSAENLEPRKKFLTRDFLQRLENDNPKVDPFTLTSDEPKAFRVGDCRITESGVELDVLLFWKTDARTEQRSIKVDAENIGDKWQIAVVKN